MASTRGHGASKKGSGYERATAKKLSKWTGENYMRTLQSGAGGTRAVDDLRMTGDIFAPLGSPNAFSYECKDHATTKLQQVFNNNGDIPSFWEQCTTDCRRVSKYGYSPMLIFHINREADYVLTPFTEWLRENLIEIEAPCQCQRTWYTQERTQLKYQFDTILTTLDSITKLPPLQMFKKYQFLDWDRLNKDLHKDTKSADEVVDQLLDNIEDEVNKP